MSTAVAILVSCRAISPWRFIRNSFVSLMRSDLVYLPIRHVALTLSPDITTFLLAYRSDNRAL